MCSSRPRWPPALNYLGVYLDDTFVVAESNESNNVVYQAITVENQTRATAVSGAYPTGNSLVDALVYDGDHWQGPTSTTTTITVYLSDFYKAWTATEIAALNAAMASWEAVANIDFQIVNTASAANFVEYVAPSSVVPALGVHGLPIAGSQQISGQFNYEGYGWDENSSTGGLVVGGYGYVILVHELGHGLGLDHPHEGSYTLPGVTVASDLGDNNLNQGIYTVMSYNDGWASFQNPFGNGLVNYGFTGGPSALDIAAIQALYGANTTHAAGDDVYTLPDTNAIGTYWTTIWDTGGTDSIVYSGTRDATINLNAASLANEPGGGGNPSWASGIYGGFTIANGVVIENATGGGGNDTITGNDANNLLIGNAGDDSISGGTGNDSIFGNTGADTLDGGTGNDKIWGGFGNDTITGGIGADLLIGNAGNDTLHGDDGWDDLRGDDGDDILYGGLRGDLMQGGAGNDKLYGEAGWDNLSGGDGYDLLYGGDGKDTLAGGNHNDKLYGGAGDDILYGDDGWDTLQGDDGNDTLYGGLRGDVMQGGTGDDMLYGEAGWDMLIGGKGNDLLIGGSGADRLFGNENNDFIDGGAGNDKLWGGLGLDMFYFADGFGVDVIYDFLPNIDKIDLSGVTAITDWNDLLTSHMSIGSNGYVTITDSANSIELAGITSISQLDQDDFIFSLPVAV